MGDYYAVRLWQLKAGHTGVELEALANSGYLEMQRWIPGVRHVTLLRAGNERTGCYVLTTTFTDYAAYAYWRQVEEEAPDYWERYAAIIMQWERISQLVGEYSGEIVLDVGFEHGH